MKQIRNLKLPLQGTVRINGDDGTILDVLFDLDIPSMNETLRKVHEKGDPVLVAMMARNIGVGLLQYKPPDIWLDYNNQLYHLYMSPNLALLHHHFVDRRMRTNDLFESQVLTQIIVWLEMFEKSQRVSHT